MLRRLALETPAPIGESSIDVASITISPIPPPARARWYSTWRSVNCPFLPKPVPWAEEKARLRTVIRPIFSGESRWRNPFPASVPRPEAAPFGIPACPSAYRNAINYMGSIVCPEMGRQWHFVQLPVVRPR